MQWWHGRVRVYFQVFNGLLGIVMLIDIDGENGTPCQCRVILARHKDSIADSQITHSTLGTILSHHQCVTVEANGT